MQAYRPATLLRRHSNFYEQLFWRTSVKGCFWEFFLLCEFERFPTWANSIINYLGSEEVEAANGGVL